MNRFTSFLIVTILATLGSFSTNSTKAQDLPYTISGQVHGLQDTVVYLANYYGDKLYYNDTARVDSKGNFEFAGKPYDEGGKYAFVIPGPKYFDFLVADEDIHFETDTLNRVENIKVHKSDNNKIFFDYIKFINNQRQARGPYDLIVGDSLRSEEQKEAALQSIQELNDEVISYQKNLVKVHADKLVGKFIKMSMEVNIPETVPEGENEETWKYYWYRAHFWDNVDMTDNRMVRDQMFSRLLDKYMNKVVPQIPDSVCAEADRMAERVRGKDDLFKFIVHTITFNAETSKIMCMDKVFVYMVEKYFKTGQAIWLDEEKLTKIIEASDKKKNSLCGEIAPNIILPDTTLTNWKSIHEVEKDYTLIVIWESSCGHCKKEMPKIKEVHEQWKDKLEVFALGQDFETEPWMKFIREKDIGDWTHVSDNPAINESDSAYKLIRAGITTLQSLNFRTTFDVVSTPKLFLLDKDKKIIAKQLGAEQVGELIAKLEGVEPEKDEAKEEEESSEGAKKEKAKGKKSKK